MQLPEHGKPDIELDSRSFEDEVQPIGAVVDPRRPRPCALSLRGLGRSSGPFSAVVTGARLVADCLAQVAVEAGQGHLVSSFGPSKVVQFEQGHAHEEPRHRQVLVVVDGSVERLDRQSVLAQMATDDANVDPQMGRSERPGFRCGDGPDVLTDRAVVARIRRLGVAAIFGEGKAASDDGPMQFERQVPAVRVVEECRVGHESCGRLSVEGQASIVLARDATRLSDGKRRRNRRGGVQRRRHEMRGKAELSRALLARAIVTVTVVLAGRGQRRAKRK